MNGRGGGIAAWALLLVALAVTLLSATRTVGFLPGHHGYLSSMALAMGKGLDREHHFLLFTRKWIDAEGKSGVDPHNRFPIVSFALIGGALSGCRNDPACEMFRGRILMLLFFWGSLALSYLLLREVSGNPLLAVSASLLSFSSYFLQYYNDMIFNDVPALFGYLLVLLGIARFEIRGSGRLLLAGALTAIALGWQPYAPLLTWWTLRAIDSVRVTGMRGAASQIARHGATRVLAIALAWGCLLLAFNVFNEKAALKLPAGDLPSVKSIRFRLGMAGGSDAFPQYQELQWRTFLSKQARRVLKATIPTRPLHGLINRWSEAGSPALRLSMVVAGLAVLAGAGACLWKLLCEKKRERLVCLVAMLSGFVWCLSMRHFTAFHDFQAMFYVGFVLVLYLAIFSRFPAKARGGLAVATIAVYAFAAVDLSRVKTAEGRPFEMRTFDFAAIRKAIGENRRIQVGATTAEFEAEFVPFRFYLAGSFYSDPAHAEFVITRDRSFASPMLTPENREIFLFRAPGPASQEDDPGALSSHPP